MKTVSLLAVVDAPRNTVVCALLVHPLNVFPLAYSAVFLSGNEA